VRTTIGDQPTEASAAFPPPTPARAEDLTPATPEQQALLEHAPVVQAVLQGLLNSAFISHLAQEVAFYQRKMALYPVTITPQDLTQGAVLTQPVPQNGRALILTMLPLEPTEPNQPVHVVMVRHTPIPQSEMTGDPAMDYARGKLEVVVYRDHPYDLRQRQIVQMGDLEPELHRQVWAVTTGPMTRPSSAFFYLTMVNVDPSANDEAPAGASETTQGQANGRAG
jgi:hypothetical protein